VKIPATNSLRTVVTDAAYLHVWMTGLCAGSAIWLETLVVGIYVIDLTHSPFFVALAVTLRLSPFVLFGTVIGAVADRTSPRMLLLVVLATAALVSSIVFFLLSIRYTHYWVLAAASLASGMVWAADMPLRRRLLGDIVGTEHLRVAMSLDSATNNGTRMVGPLIGGLLYQGLGAIGAFALNACLYIVCLLMILHVPARLPSSGRTVAKTGILKDVQEVFSFSVRDGDVFRILLSTVIFNVWAVPFLSMIPVIGRNTLNLNAGWIGGLAAFEGFGAFFGALAIAAGLVIRNFRRVYYFSILAYLILTFVAGSVVDIVPMAAILLCVGVASAGFSAMQSTLIYSLAPPHMRSRLFGVVVICIGMGLVGTANIGLMAQWFGTSSAIQIVAAEGLIPLLAIGMRWPQLRGQVVRPMD
jgi:MFS family permease